MSNIEELRLRLEDAERRFGLKSAKNNQYSVRLVQLVDAVVDDLWVQRRDHERLSFENEEFRSMLISLLATIEGGDKDDLRTMMHGMAERIATLMAAGAGAPSYEPVLERYPDPEFDPEPALAPNPVHEPAPQYEANEEEIPLSAADLPEIVDVSPPQPLPEEINATAIDDPVLDAPEEFEQSSELPDIDVDTISAAVADLAHKTKSVKPVLDFGSAEPQTPEPVATHEAEPVPPVQIDEPVAGPPPAADETPSDIAAMAPTAEMPREIKTRTGEFADLHNVLDDIRELVGLMDPIDAPSPTEPGHV
ncbi:MAG: hypothetical protein HOL89_06430 [Alphaproteobacteria bacterium]|nr:hypothetical protein [Alphaproteobacteria bacterium]